MAGSNRQKGRLIPKYLSDILYQLLKEKKKPIEITKLIEMVVAIKGRVPVGEGTLYELAKSEESYFVIEECPSFKLRSFTEPPNLPKRGSGKRHLWAAYKVLHSSREYVEIREIVRRAKDQKVLWGVNEPAEWQMYRNLSDYNEVFSQRGTFKIGLKEWHSERDSSKPQRQQLSWGESSSASKPTKGKRRRYGPKIQFRGLQHAPINENGVIFLFGMLAEELGFEIESIQGGFPDCEAKLKNRDGTFERVTIEFEFKSSAFPRHGHDPNGCDYLVCWEHDWKGCPDSLTMIELSKVIRGEEH